MVKAYFRRMYAIARAEKNHILNTSETSFDNIIHATMRKHNLYNPMRRDKDSYRVKDFCNTFIWGSP